MAETGRNLPISVEIAYPTEGRPAVSGSAGAFVPRISIPAQTRSFEDVQAPDPKKEAIIQQTVDVRVLERKLKNLQLQLERLTLTKEAEKKEEKITELPKPLEPVQFLMSSPYVILPALSGVAHPMFLGQPNSFSVAVGSIYWLRALDQLRAAGWHFFGPTGIEMFLLKSAWIVKEELNYNVMKKEQADGSIIDLDLDLYYRPGLQKKAKNAEEAFENDILSRKFKYFNNIEKFCMWYPDAERQPERLKKGYSKLLNDIRKNLPIQAFLPQNYDSMIEGDKPKCPPKDSDFYVGDTKMKGILRNWTETDPRSTVYVNVGNRVKMVHECRPPQDIQFSWIPMEYREKIEELYNLIQFRYTLPETYKKFMYTLTKHEELDKTLRTMDDAGRVFITVKGRSGEPNGKLFLASLHLNYPVNINREGIPDGELTLREWMQNYVNDLSLYPVIHIILNAPVPANEGTPTKPGIYKNYIYYVNVKGRKIPKMFADAPTRAFKHGLVEQFVGRPRPGEDAGNCLERFLKNVYDVMLQYPVLEHLPPQIPEKYARVLTELFNYGGEPSQCAVSSMTALSSLEPSERSLRMPRVTWETLKGENEKQLLSRATDLLNIAKNLA